ncbi:MAG: AEC family transporter [Rhizobiales bacterium]|jgi:predicted permease|nr:AEC family transporter [Hyphomicrobiales bacterium]
MPILQMLSLTVPIFLLIGLGAISARSGLIEEKQVEGLAAFVLNFALPALVLGALARQDLGRTFDWRYVAAYAGGSLVAFLAVFSILRFGLKRPFSSAAIGGMGGATSNTGFVGFPVTSLAFGSLALTAMPLNMMVENMLIIPLALALAEWGKEEGVSVGRTVVATAKRLSRTPLILAILLGAVLSLLHVPIPGVIGTAIDMLAKASAPCALFVVGGTVAILGASGRASGVAAEVGWIVATKLLLHPLAVAAAFYLIGGTNVGMERIGIVLASVSMVTVYPIFGARYGVGGISSMALVSATAIGFFTITATLSIVLG